MVNARIIINNGDKADALPRLKNKKIIVDGLESIVVDQHGPYENLLQQEYYELDLSDERMIFFLIKKDEKEGTWRTKATKVHQIKTSPSRVRLDGIGD